MALQDFPVEALELIESRVGSPWNANGSRTYKKVWRVLTNNKKLNAADICRAPGIDGVMAPYFEADTGFNDLAAVMVSLNAEKEHREEWKHWLVTAEYSTTVPEGGMPDQMDFGDKGRGAQNNPDQIKPIIKWDKEVVTRALYKDLDGLPFTNAAGQPLTPAPTFETARSVLLIVRNEVEFTRARTTNYAFAVNSDKFLGAAPGTVRSDPPIAERMFLGSIAYWRVSYRLVFGAIKERVVANVKNLHADAILSAPGPNFADEELESWQPQFLNAGTMKRLKVIGVPFEGLAVPITRHGHPVTHPVLLDLEGQELVRVDAKGVAAPATGTFKPTYIDRRVYKERPFNPLLANSIRGL